MNDLDNLPTRGARELSGGPVTSAGTPPSWLNEPTPVPLGPWLGLTAPDETPRGARDVPADIGPPDDIDAALGELPGLLARAASGIEFIYKTLELIAARYGLRDVVVVVRQADQPQPQIFRLGRASLADEGPLPPHLAAALSGREGLYADPPVVGPAAAACVTSLVELALRLDLLAHDASHDALTGLLNRRSYELLLRQAVSRANRYGWPFALVLLDLDNFKVVNDQHGHAAGDAALKVMGAELRASVRAGDVAARLGGDEFALLVLGVDSAAALSPLLGRVKQALARAVPDTDVSFSVGVACFPADTDDLEALTTLADARLYRAKAALSQRDHGPQRGEGFAERG